MKYFGVINPVTQEVVTDKKGEQLCIRADDVAGKEEFLAQLVADSPALTVLHGWTDDDVDASPYVVIGEIDTMLEMSDVIESGANVVLAFGTFSFITD